MQVQEDVIQHKDDFLVHNEPGVTLTKSFLAVDFFYFM